MFTRILHNSERLCTFFDQLELQLYRPQRQHILNMADALLVCEDDKTLAALQRQFVEAPDASNMADCLRISPWQADDVRAVLRANQVAWRSESTRLNSSHDQISYAVFCLKTKRAGSRRSVADRRIHR